MQPGLGVVWVAQVVHGEHERLALDPQRSHELTQLVRGLGVEAEVDVHEVEVA